MIFGGENGIEIYTESYRSGHNGADSKWSTRLFVLSSPKPSSNAGLSQFKKVNILLFCPVVLSLVFFQNFRLNIWRVVRVVEGAALEMLCSQKEPRVRIPNSPPKSPVTMRVCWTFLFSPSGLVCDQHFLRGRTAKHRYFLPYNRFIVRLFYLTPLALKSFSVRQKHSAHHGLCGGYL